jgi:preprotein translocase subunit SecE
MRRELRRHPVQAKPARGTNRPPRMPRGGSGKGAGPSGTALSRATLPIIPKKLQVWYQEIFGELRKVQWPTRQEVMNLTMVVIVVSTALGIALGGVDALFNWVLERTLLS